MTSVGKTKSQVWLESKDSHEMMQLLVNSKFIEQPCTPRKMRLFGLACCRESKWFYDEEKVNKSNHLRTLVDLQNIEAWIDSKGYKPALHKHIPNAMHWIVQDDAIEGAIKWCINQYNKSLPQETKADILREIIGNPFESVKIDPNWLTPDVIDLTTSTYDNQVDNKPDPTRLLILADSLEEAGCNSEHIMNHLRHRYTTHRHGCWVLDLLLNKR